MRPSIALSAALLMAPLALPAQRPDYHRADVIRTAGAYVLGATVTPVWLEDSVRFLYTSTGKDDRGTIYLVDPARATRRVYFDHARLAAVLSVAGDTILDPERFPAFTAVDSGKAIELVFHHKVFRCDPASYNCTAQDSVDWALKRTLKNGPTWANRSPDRKWDVFQWRYNLYLRPAALSDSDAYTAADSVRKARADTTKKNGAAARPARGAAARNDSIPLPKGSIALTTDGERLFAYGNTERDVAADTAKPRPTRVPLNWTPDSRRFTVARDDYRRTRIYPMYSSTGDQPVDKSYHYAVPSDSIVPTHVVHAIDIVDRTNVRAKDAPVPQSTASARTFWNRAGDHFYMLSANRGPSRISALLVDAKTGETTTITRDSTATWVELSHSFGQENWDIAKGSDDLIWWSERDGWGHLYRFGADGTLKNQVENGRYVVDRLFRVDSATRLTPPAVYFTAWGKGSDFLYYSHLYRVNADGSGTTPLTPEAGDHAITFTPKGPYFIDTHTEIDKAPVIRLRSAIDGKVILELQRGDIELLRNVGWRPPEIIKVKARDGVTDLWGLMYKPSTFDSTRSYPILDHIYPGPQVGSVGRWGWSGTGEPQALAELGFIVVQIDHQGTPRRSKAFHDFYYRNMVDNGIPDHIAGIRQLGAAHRWIDMDRIGIFGHSGGGLASTDAILRYPDFYKVAVSGSGNHHPDTYAWYWAGRYQGPYNKASYDSSANYTMARNLKGHLLLMHGDMDNNVHLANTLKLVDALIKANKANFDLMIFPDAPHGLPTFHIRKRWDYLVRYLLNEEPPADYQMIEMPRPVFRPPS
ncbi:MAG: prolyl oligopeptidase family serine peptidase [Gemmatimonadaceae bacterium]|nr:prolyl oligopeptidase family serine peptidase [Gemmatimonadaceae bacterium]